MVNVGVRRICPESQNDRNLALHSSVARLAEQDVPSRPIQLGQMPDRTFNLLTCDATHHSSQVSSRAVSTHLHDQVFGTHNRELRKRPRQKTNCVF